MADETPIKLKPKKKLQADLVQAVKKGDFKKAARLRESIANMK